MRVLLTITAIFVLCSEGNAQRFSFGVLGGIPVSAVQRKELIGSRAGYGEYYLATRRYTVGGMVAARIPLGFFIEGDALYRRVDSTQAFLMNPNFGRVERLAANAWEFPMVLGRRWNRGPKPFAIAGGAFRRVGEYDWSTESINTGFTPPRSVFTGSGDYGLIQGGWVAGGGFDLFRLGPLKVTPQVRYTRWTSPRLEPTQNQVDVLVALRY